MTDFIKLHNPKIVEFYESHPFIDYEKANILLVDMFKNCIHYEPTQNSKNNTNNDNITTNTATHIMPNVTFVKEYKEPQNLEMILNKLNPTAEVLNNTDNNIIGDYIIVSPNKIVETNVKPCIINMFANSCKAQKANGILMSQHTGITGKQNFEIDFIDSNVIIYIHCAEYNEEKIQMAFEIMNKLHNKIKLLNTDNNNSISSDVLHEIKNEYQQLVAQKSELQNNIKNNLTQIIHQRDNMNLSNLGDYLSTKFTQMEKKYLYKCNLCNFYTSNTLKGMAAHKRGCKKKHATSQN